MPELCLCVAPDSGSGGQVKKTLLLGPLTIPPGLATRYLA